MNYSFLIELCHVFIIPLSKATKNEPIGSNTENCKEVIELCYFCMISVFPTINFGLPLTGSVFKEPKKIAPKEVPIAKLIPFGLKIADVNVSSFSSFN